MKIGIIGAGNMGFALGKVWAQKNHQVKLGFTTNLNALKEKVEQTSLTNLSAGDVSEVVSFGDVFFFAAPPHVMDKALEGTDLKGKIVLSCSSGLKPDFEGNTVGLPSTLAQSVAETLAGKTGAKVVEAFNITFAEILQLPSRDFDAEHPSIFYCGDDAQAKDVAKSLIHDAGYSPVDAGKLKVARSLETLATAWVQFAVASGLFPKVGLKVLR